METIFFKAFLLLLWVFLVSLLAYTVAYGIDARDTIQIFFAKVLKYSSVLTFVALSIISLVAILRY